MEITSNTSRYWWVNQNQTFEQEFKGGYLWSPKRNANGRINHFYETMREVSPGDLILSFQGTYIRGVGIANSYCYTSPKPEAFGMIGQNWNTIGWKVDVKFIEFNHQIRPKEHIDKLNAMLPTKYSPLQANGNGNQGIYLTEILAPLMHSISNLIGQELVVLMKGNFVLDEQGEYKQEHDIELDDWDEHVKESIKHDLVLTETEKSSIITSRLGQGRFKKNVQKYEKMCRITKVEKSDHLIASHIKPWRVSNNEERLDGENGLLLTPTIDHLFDRGFISFEDSGRLIVSPVAHRQSLEKMGIDTKEKVNVGRFSSGQRGHLDYHRDSVFLESKAS